MNNPRENIKRRIESNTNNNNHLQTYSSIWKRFYVIFTKGNVVKDIIDKNIWSIKIRTDDVKISPANISQSEINKRFANTMKVIRNSNSKTLSAITIKGKTCIVPRKWINITQNMLVVQLHISMSRKKIKSHTITRFI